MPTRAQHMCQPHAGTELHVRKARRLEGTVCGQLPGAYGQCSSEGHKDVAFPSNLHQGELLLGSGMTSHGCSSTAPPPFDFQNQEMLKVKSRGDAPMCSRAH